MNICSNIKVFLLFIKEIYFEMILLTLFNRTKTVWQILIILPNPDPNFLSRIWSRSRIPNLPGWFIIKV